MLQRCTGVFGPKVFKVSTASVEGGHVIMYLLATHVSIAIGYRLNTETNIQNETMLLLYMDWLDTVRGSTAAAYTD